MELVNIGDILPMMKTWMPQPALIHSMTKLHTKTTEAFLKCVCGGVQDVNKLWLSVEVTSGEHVSDHPSWSLVALGENNDGNVVFIVIFAQQLVFDEQK